MDVKSLLGGNQMKVRNTVELIVSLKDYFDIALISKLSKVTSSNKNDIVIRNNEDFWEQALALKIYAGQIIKLKDFKILEWIPSSPGLFHTHFATMERDRAIRRHFENEKRQGIKQNIGRLIELRPGDKRSMIKGGFGSLRIGPKTINYNLKYLMCASSNGISHEGIVTIMGLELYNKVIAEIKENKTPTVNLVGRVMLLPKELSLINFEYNREVPKFYLEVEELELIKNEKPNQSVVSVAVTYAKEEDLKKSDAFSYSFCQFSPTHTENNISGITDWLKSYAIKYSGTDSPLIIGDFDEYYNHFEKVEFPIRDIANGKISVENLHKFQKLFDFKINETTMGDKNIFNNSQIGAVGSNAKSTKNKFQQNNYSLPDDLNFELLSKELKKLKKNLKDKANSSKEFGALSEVAKAQTAAKDENGNKVVQHLLNGGKWVFNTAKDIGVSVVAELINRQI